MTWIDLSLLVSEQIPIYPGGSTPQIRETPRRPEGFLQHDVKFGLHVGTHIDAPYHVLETGKRLIDFPIEKFTGPGVVIDVTKTKEITKEAIRSDELPKGGIVLLHTNWVKNLNEPDYFTENPYLTQEAAEFLASKNPKMVGIDGPNIDKHGNIESHRALLGNDILLIESLTNLDQLLGKSFELFAFPMRIEKVDGAPCRVVARVLPI